MTRVAARLPGYASTVRASEILHLAPRSVRDLIYAGRLPSLRVGRLHYIKTADLELERRRRLGLPLPTPRQRVPTKRVSHPENPTRTHPAVRRERAAQRAEMVDPALRRERAAQRAEMVARWAQHHHLTVLQPEVPFVVLSATSPVTCAVCGREIRRGRIVELAAEGAHEAVRFCTACGRRAMLEWADRRRQEAAAARRLSASLGEPVPPAQDELHAA